MKRAARIRRIVSALVVMILMTLVFFLTRPERADVVFVGGVIHTLDQAGTTVEALAVKDGNIIGLGTTDEVLSRFHADTTVELGGRPVIPGFVDAHGRLFNAGILAMTLDLRAEGSVTSAAALVRRHSESVPSGTWIRGRGWLNAWWNQESRDPRAILDEAAPAHPVFLLGEDGETAWVNTAALRQAGISMRASEHEPATVVRDRSGAPIGIVLEDASRAVQEAMPPPTEWELSAALDSAAAGCLRSGITTIHDFGVGERELALYEKRAREGTMPIRVYAVVSGSDSAWHDLKERGILSDPLHERFSAAAFELYVDGALESHSAALIEAYADEATSRGITLADERDLAAAIRTAMDTGFQLCIIARGDRAAAIALSAVAETVPAERRADRTVRLEGLQLMRSEDLARAAELGVVVSLVPAQYLLDFELALSRLGQHRIEQFMPWPGLLEHRVIVAGGTDMPIGVPSPLLGISLVVERSEAAGQGGRAARLDALRMYTLWSAVAGREESRKGSLEVGKLADFLVLSDDPLAVPHEELAALGVEMTVLGGSICFRRE